MSSTDKHKVKLHYWREGKLSVTELQFNSFELAIEAIEEELLFDVLYDVCKVYNLAGEIVHERKKYHKEDTDESYA